MDGLPKRKSNRLPQFDYGTVGAYFITICSRDRAKVFGRVVGGGVLDAPRTLPSPHGKIVIAQIEAMENFYPGLQIEKFELMPNHIHLLLRLDETPGQAGIPQIVRQMKAHVSKRAGFSIWQRSYYDHVIRGQKDYDMIWQYIADNPAKWLNDRFYEPDEP